MGVYDSGGSNYGYPMPPAGTFGSNVYETQNQAAFQRELERLGLAFNPGNRAQYARGLFGQTQDAYQAAVPFQGLDYRYTDWLTNEFPKLFESSYGAASPHQRGEANPMAGRVRWVGF